mgnify:CR=1 FL=1
MLLFKILSYLGGFVTISVPEECLERFINMATARGIFLWGIMETGADRVALKVRLSGVRPMRHVARMTRCRFRIEARAGLPFVIGRLKRRKTLLGGALLFMVVLYMLSSFIWEIKVTGHKRVDEQVIEQLARQSGLYRGALRWAVNERAVEDVILRQVPGLSWVSVHIEGTRARIEVVEKKLPPRDGAERPFDVVADKDGLVKEILVFSGHPLVKEGDTVAAGQVLISAAVPPPTLPDASSPETGDEQAGEVRYVHARGIVRARVWYKGYGEKKLVEKGLRRTGREITKLGIKIDDKEIILMGPREVPFQHFGQQVFSKSLPAWRNIRLPVEFITVKYFEQKPYVKRYGVKEAERLAGEEALARIRRRIPPGAGVLQVKQQVVKTAGYEDMVRVKVLVETLEDIGMEKPHRGDRGGSGAVHGERGS